MVENVNMATREETTGTPDTGGNPVLGSGSAGGYGTNMPGNAGGSGPDISSGFTTGIQPYGIKPNETAIAVGITSAQHTVNQITDEVNSWFKAWFQAIINNLTSIQQQIQMGIEQPIIEGVATWQSLLDEIDTQLVQGWAAIHEPLATLGLAPWATTPGNFAIPQITGGRNIQSGAAVLDATAPRNQPGGRGGPVLPVQPPPYSSGSGTSAPPIAPSIPPPAPGPYGLCIGSDNQIYAAQYPSNWVSLGPGVGPQDDWVALGLAEYGFGPLAIEWGIKVCGGCLEGLPVDQGGCPPATPPPIITPPPPPPPSPTLPGGGGGPIVTVPSGGGADTCCPPQTINLQCTFPDTVTFNTATPQKYPVDLDQPVALFFGDFDDDYLAKYDQFYGGIATKLRGGASIEDLADDYLPQ